MEFEEEEKTDKTQDEQVQIDSFFYYLTASVIVKPWDQWAKLRLQFVNALGRISAKIQSDPEQVEFSIRALPEGGLTDKEKRIFLHALPMLQGLCLMQYFKKHFDCERLNLETGLSGAQYVHKLQEVLSEGDLSKQLDITRKAFDEYKLVLSSKKTFEEIVEYLGVQEEFGAQVSDAYAWLKSLS